MTASPATTIAANLKVVRERMAAACDRAGRDAAAVRLIAVTKTFGPDAVEEAIAAGVTDIGENYVREGLAKREALAAKSDSVSWHLIGHLQTNKVRDAVAVFDVIQTVDSLRLAQSLSSRALRPVPVLLEVNVAAEASKSGFAPSEVAEAASSIGRLPNLDLRGLMTVAPLADSSGVRRVFRALRELADANGVQELSMGMSGDFEVAIEEGSTMVRIGRAIFGERGR